MPADDKQIPSVWARPRPDRRQPLLTRESIVAEAVRLLDEEGLDNLSMRRLGSRLGAGATSLYRHVASKDELLELALDAVYEELPLPDTGDWRTTVTEVARAMRATILRHPWLAAKLGDAGLAYLGPNMLRQSEFVLGVMEDAGFPLAEADQAVTTVMAYVVGISTGEAAWLSTVARSGLSEQELTEKLWPAAEQAVQDYPRLRARYAQQRDGDTSGVNQDTFEYGLQRVLDGLQARLA
ncbi:Transcriptional regulator, TetR family [[Actinomadura] parvosata subsp. kistnae]|uniref:TetR family transcriptional regulator n=1 Tax=[Actinomadura] parvosata subsp. kistnae TaxID=1909395 RepID=A0A1V0A5I1_9ACTN|nr:TetR/AcrR family transcriptional regulator [Nonomuraea sp. ATCC 55076]AQZ65464.1 TetR family transcriptional regulator [Nonomuraea sp. ATCC 55076]SPL96805.1 Transcriptional regulator, TetR family [Actinomadura parvosata subsp. kistnae]